MPLARTACVTVVVALAATLVWAVVRVAWISDDAYITLRVVENVVDGHGPVWNTAERVQVYSHPLWMMLLTAARWLVGAHYPATIALSLLTTLAAVALLLRRTGSLAGAAVVIACLLASRAFADYATSGLETPLSMLLLVLLCTVGSEPRPRPVRHRADNRPAGDQPQRPDRDRGTAAGRPPARSAIAARNRHRGSRPGTAVAVGAVLGLLLRVGGADHRLREGAGTGHRRRRAVRAGLHLLRQRGDRRPGNRGLPGARHADRTRRGQCPRTPARRRRAAVLRLRAACRRRLHGRPLPDPAVCGRARPARPAARAPARRQPALVAARAAAADGLRHRRAGVSAPGAKRSAPADVRPRHLRRTHLLLPAQRTAQPRAGSARAGRDVAARCAAAAATAR